MVMLSGICTGAGGVSLGELFQNRQGTMTSRPLWVQAGLGWAPIAGCHGSLGTFWGNMATDSFPPTILSASPGPSSWS